MSGVSSSTLSRRFWMLLSSALRAWPLNRSRANRISCLIDSLKYSLSRSRAERSFSILHCRDPLGIKQAVPVCAGACVIWEDDVFGKAPVGEQSRAAGASPGLSVNVAQQMHQPLHQRPEQRLQLEARLHQLLDAGHYRGVAGEHFPLRWHHVGDEGVAPTLLLEEDNTHTSHRDTLTHKHTLTHTAADSCLAFIIDIISSSSSSYRRPLMNWVFYNY